MASVFEFHFNPLLRPFGASEGQANPKQNDSVFDTFCFLPQTLFEKKQGNLYLVAEIKNPAQNSQLVLNRTAEIIKKYFYQKPVFTSQDSFQLGLNQANDFLSDWQGNLNFAAIVVGPKCNIKVSKTGNLKIILFRDNEAFDIGSNFDSHITSGKIFPDVIEGNLQKGDRLLVATSEVFHSFQNEQILENLAQRQKPKLIKQVFKEKKKILREFSGACLLAFVKKRWLVSAFFFWDDFDSKQKTVFLTAVSFFLLAIALSVGYFTFR
ncbi:MAG: hypothetical protein PHW31_04420 [Candidatus Pacebacteria bacterium]|nr:hypothetical protein [Candidatus Paceibacterota bacterium]